MIKVEIKNAEVVTRHPTNKRTGEVMTFREQTGWAHLGDDYPQKIQISLAPDQAPYPVGTYVLGRGSFRVGAFDRLEVGRLELEPMQSKGS